MCEYGIPLLGKAPDHWVYARTACGSWYCADCAAGMTAQHAGRGRHGAALLLDAGYELLFITITSHERIRTLDSGLRVWRNAWPRIRARLDRAMRPRKPNSPKHFIQIGVKYEYLLVPELHADGALHVHAIVALRGRKVGIRRLKRWLKRAARQCGMGYQNDVRRVERPHTVLRYVVKYLTKAGGAGGWPKRTRRVNYSRGWPRTPGRESAGAGYVWESRPGLELEQALSLAMRAGVDLHHQGHRVTTDAFL